VYKNEYGRIFVGINQIRKNIPEKAKKILSDNFKEK